MEQTESGCAYELAPPESPQHKIFFGPRNPLHPNHLPTLLLPRPPKSPHPHAVLWNQGGSSAPAHRNHRPGETSLSHFFEILTINLFVFNKSSRRGKTCVSHFHTPICTLRETSPAAHCSATSSGPPYPPPRPRAPSPCDSPARRRSFPDRTRGGSAPPEETPPP